MINGHFITCQKGDVFVTEHPAVKPSEVCVLCLPPLFEEMNLSRAVIAKQSQYLAQHGFSTFVLDYLGTGDSDGEMDDFVVADWHDNLVSTLDFLSQKGFAKVILWGVRFGALLLASERIASHPMLAGVLLWKPLLKGAQQLNDLCRVKTMQAKFNDEPVHNWRESVLAGETINFSGYLLSADVFNSIDTLSLTTLSALNCPVNIFELAAAQASPVIQQLSSTTSHRINLQVCEAVPFWRTPNIFEQSGLHAMNLKAVREMLL